MSEDECALGAYQYACRLRNVKTKTINDYLLDARLLSRFAANRGKGLTQLTSSDMEVYFLGLMEREKPLSGYTINNRLRFYRRLYGFFLMKGYVQSNPTLTLSYIRPKRRQPVLLSPQDFVKVITRLRHRRGFYALRAECIILLAYDSALRINELLTIKRDSIQFQPRMIHLLGKYDKERIVSFGPETAHRLRLYLSRRAFMRVPGDLLFSTRAGNKIQNRLGHRLFKMSGRAVGVKLAPHMVRRSTATLIRNQTGDLQLVRDILGHTSVETTQIYTQSCQAEIVQAYQKWSPVSNAFQCHHPVTKSWSF